MLTLAHGESHVPPNRKGMMDVSKTLRTALEQLRIERTRLDRQITALERALDGPGGKTAWRAPGRRGASVGLGACPGSAAAARPVAACATIAGRPVLGGLDAIPGAQTGGVRRPAAPRSVAASCCRGGRPYAVVRRTRRRAGAGRRCRPGGAADGLALPAPAAPDRRPAGPRRRAIPAR